MQTRLRDPARSFTPNGRPMRKPRKIAMRLASISSRSDLSEMYVLERPSTKSWQEPGLRACLESRPSAKLDLSGPTPCTYSVTQHWKYDYRAPRQPAAKYNRDALPYPNTEVWTHNVNRTGITPTPCTYTHPSVLGYCPTKKSAPAYSLRARNLKPLKTKGAVPSGPAPNLYNHANALDTTLRHFPAITIATKNNTGKHVPTPGPAHYSPNHTHCYNRSPAYSMRIRPTKSSST